MPEAHVSALQRKIAAIEAASPVSRARAGGFPDGGSASLSPASLSPASLSFGVAEIDRYLPNGLPCNDLHELVGAPGHGGAVTGFALALAARLMACRPGHLLWVQQGMAGREAGLPYAPGLHYFGLDPDRLLFVQPRRDRDVMWSLAEGLGCRALVLVLAELWEGPACDLTASRRLRLAARASGVMALVIRYAGPPDPAAGLGPGRAARGLPPSAAHTRWRVAPGAGHVPGPERGSEREPEWGLGLSRWQLSLEKNRTGRTGAWIVEWNPHVRRFQIPLFSTPIAHSGPLAAHPGDRQGRTGASRTGAGRTGTGRTGPAGPRPPSRVRRAG
jgi:protein ImuA